jgi:NAD-dependent deacetylase
MSAIETNHDGIEKVVSIMRDSQKIFVVTGAGISADSGLPVYRGIGGLYNDQDTEDGIPIEKALSGPVFRSQPEITWKYMGQIEQGARNAKFNRGHEVLAEMEKHFEHFWILTQNIDGFHTFAGSENVIEIHGNMHRLKCTACDTLIPVENYADIEIPPFCKCGQMQRPDVVLFEEMLPEKAIQQMYHQQETVDYDLVVSIGTSANFPYISEPIMIANRRGVATVEINPGVSNISSFVDVHLKMGAAESLNEIWKRYNA